MFDLDSITGTRHRCPPRIVLHGQEKVGKSTFFAGAPDPIFVPTEDGLNGIDAKAFPLSRTLEEFMSALTTLCQSKHDFRTVVVDSADWLERLIHRRVIDDWNASKGDNAEVIDKTHGGYGKGYIVANDHFREVLTALDYLSKERGMIVGLICHSKLITVTDPDAEPVDMYRMKLHSPRSGNGAGDILNEWADIIGFASIPKRVTRRETEGAGHKVLKSGSDRVLYLDGSPAFVAGNRYGLPSELPLRWSDLEAAISKQSN